MLRCYFRSCRCEVCQSIYFESMFSSSISACQPLLSLPAFLRFCLRNPSWFEFLLLVFNYLFSYDLPTSPAGPFSCSSIFPTFCFPIYLSILPTFCSLIYPSLLSSTTLRSISSSTDCNSTPSNSSITTSATSFTPNSPYFTQPYNLHCSSPPHTLSLYPGAAYSPSPGP